MKYQRGEHPNSKRNLTYVFPKQHIPWNKGKKGLQSWHNISGLLRGNTGRTRFKIGHQSSKKQKEIARRNFLGENNPRWKGGVSKEKDYYIKKHKEYFFKNPEKVREWKRNHSKTEKYREWARKRYYKRKTDPMFYLNLSMGNAIRKFLRGYKNGKHWELLVGYKLEKLITHLEKQFTPEMNWRNYGNYWVIDHIKPKSLFVFQSPEDKEFKECWGLKNLQPLEKITNIKKGNNYV